MTMYGITKDAKVCANCKYYYQHWAPYAEPGVGFSPIHAGHCTYPRFKDREPNQTCGYFERRTEPLLYEEGRPLVLLDRARETLKQLTHDLATVQNWIDANTRR